MRGVSKDGRGLMVRDGARAPPHHEASSLMPERVYHRRKQPGRNNGMSLGGEMNSVDLQMFSGNAGSGYRDDLDAAAAKLCHDRRELRVLVALT